MDECQPLAAGIAPIISHPIAIDAGDMVGRCRLTVFGSQGGDIY